MSDANKTPHFLRFTRALALVGSLATFGAQSAGCAASVAPMGDGGDTGVADSNTVACTCCPSGDLSGRCAVTSGGGGGAPIADAGFAPRPADSGAEPPDPDGGSMDRIVDAGVMPPPPPFDSGVAITYLDPPAGSRWCTISDLSPPRPGGPSCPVAGPLAPPELDA